jgi:pyruvate/2-oxoacid:ferredoxin oxidoreductase alpha subunit
MRSTFCNEDERPTVFGFVMGLGGRDVTPEAIEKAIHVTLDNHRPKEEVIWIDLKG